MDAKSNGNIIGEKEVCFYPVCEYIQFTNFLHRAIKKLYVMARKKKTKKANNVLTMPVVNPHAAGVDMGSRSHFVCVSQDNVKEFGVCTSDLHLIASHLKDFDVKTVALESTGFYWRPLYLLLLDYGFEVFLVNSRHLKNVKGHKTDVVDSKWIQLLHSIGLLSNSFQPDTFTHELRVLCRHRKSLVEGASRYISKMNKVLVLMNIQLKTVLRDITGESGLKVIESILSGLHDPKVLSNQVSFKVKASREEIEKALVGDFRKEYLFELRQCYDFYNFYWQKIRETDIQIEMLLQERVAGKPEAKEYKKPKNKGQQKNDPKFNVGKYAYQLTGGVELMEINGVGAITILTLISETGCDLSKFKSENHLASWLGFAPNRKITGGKVISSRTRKKTNPLAKAIRDAANAAANSDSRLGDFARRLAYRKGRMVAINATARKIAVIIYKMVTEGKPFSYEYSQKEQEYVKNKRVKNIMKTIKSYGIKAEELGFVVS